MKRPTLLALLLPSLGVTSACTDDQKVDIGSAGTLISDYAATWEGYTEAYQFYDGSDRVRLVLDAKGAGTLRVGDAPLAPPATDPDVGYPAGDWWFQDGVDPRTFLNPVIVYPVQNPRIESARIRLDISPLEAYRGWCALQTPYKQLPPSDIYQCAPSGDATFDPPDNCQLTIDGPPAQTIPIDCQKWAFCTGKVCACNATRCFPAAPDIVVLDGALKEAGTELVGTMVLGESVTFRLTRQ